MRILALDHGSKRIGIAVSDELKVIAQPLEFIAAEPFADVLARLRELIRDKQVEIILVGMPRNMDGSYGPAALKVQAFVAALKGALRGAIRHSGRGISKCATMPSACTPVSVRLELCTRGRLGKSFASASSIFSCTPVPVFCTCQPS